MQDSVSRNCLSKIKSASSSPVQIKLEQSSQDSQSWWSLPSSLSDPTIPLPSIPSLSQLGRSPSSCAKRAEHFYPPQRNSPGYRKRRHPAPPQMSGPFGTWSPASVKNESDFVTEAPQNHRRASDGDRQQPYHHFVQVGSIRRSANRSDIRANSSSPNISSSSLTGAMGDTPTTMSSHSSPSSDVSYHEQPRVHASPHPTMDWDSEVTHLDDLLPPGGTSMQSNSISYYASSTTSSPVNSPGLFNLSYTHHNHASYQNLSGSVSPESSIFVSPTYSDGPNYPISRSLPSATQHSTRHIHLVPVPMDLIPLSPVSPPALDSCCIPERDNAEEEILMLRNKVRELELQNESSNRRMREMQLALESESGFSQPTINPSGLPSPLPTPPSIHSFHESWTARTNARVRAFCSLNRAGNALCAWHDSRRERRAYPPRMAPAGYLNCGCTYEEALFEESLARHGVGSYHPGESVRMDPALRNPLLKLLQQRYGYRDGEFERDSISGLWAEGEGATFWEARAQAGSSKRRVDDRRS